MNIAVLKGNHKTNDNSNMHSNEFIRGAKESGHENLCVIIA